ncbi:HNH endonuclease signature motif containing protein [Nocardioides flavescens]|uniref:HNH nuclease domain-containing protein n=1 Tax=Nocardioides flavescens TaxID=2691959 RepID=A0A6L7F1U1_9ACTN|nr:HNH endonuclease signature motif containing protein [Nocardioides flavescens]MXG91319.1 hypothetical protein [Nocardioides flavescens]
MTAAPLTPVAPPVPTAVLLERIVDAAARRTAVEVELAELALAWAHAHVMFPASEVTWGYDPDAPYGLGDSRAHVESVEWHALPWLHWDAAASFAAAQGMSTAAAEMLLRDVLTLELRLPLTWARVRAGEVAVWRARRVAQGVIGQANDVAAYVDAAAAPRAHSIGVTGIEHLVEEAMQRLHVEQYEIEQLEALETREVAVSQPPDRFGVGEYVIRADQVDLTAFETTIGRLAAALRRDGSEESLDVRRSQAVGIIADPARAQALLDGTGVKVPASREVFAYLHLTEANLLGLDPVTLDHTGRPHLTQTVAGWAGRDDLRLTIAPVHHCTGCVRCESVRGGHEHDARAHTQHDPLPAQRTQVELQDPTCVFPYCTRPTRACDLDHRVPFPDGVTCPCNLTPLCRHHHRLKTHAGWRYRPRGPAGSGTYEWTDRYGQVFVRDRAGTTAGSTLPT